MQRFTSYALAYPIALQTGSEIMVWVLMYYLPLTLLTGDPISLLHVM